ncbi:MAG: flagellar biosynthetic protein FliO [Clostridium sp.]|jgi:flagellar protein FliO/FliZ|nr:flagellar biosynthetic protein FliO [Clostridium sp.]
MLLSATGTLGGLAEGLALLAVFFLVLGVTAFTTKWIASYQKQQNSSHNVEVIETTRIANNKYVQILRIGETYIAVGIGKDSVAILCEVPKEQLSDGHTQMTGSSFRNFLDKALKKREQR